MSHLVSFRTFLQTGHFGPINPTQNLLEVSKLIGPPNWWDCPGDAPCPLYWGYDSKNGSKLEISFLQDPPHAMHWFQIEHAAYIQSKFEIFGTGLSLATEGFKGSTAPSQFIISNIWDVDAVKIHLAASGLDLAVEAGTILIHFYLPNEYADTLSSTEIKTYTKAFGQNPSFGDVDRLYLMDSIYSYANMTDA